MVILFYMFQKLCSFNGHHALNPNRITTIYAKYLIYITFSVIYFGLVDLINYSGYIFRLTKPPILNKPNPQNYSKSQNFVVKAPYIRI